MKQLQTYNSLFIVLICVFTSNLNAQTYSQFIHVDQFGYDTSSEKVAVITDPRVGYNANESYNPGNILELRNAATDNVVYTGTIEIWNNGDIHDFSGDRGWWFDFSDFNEVGSYYVNDPSTNHRSGAFMINENPFAEVIKAATKIFYYNRCNAPKVMPYAEANWTDTDNFPQDAEVTFAFDQGNPATVRDLTGGWFDAGDYNKYVTFAHNPIHQLLTSYEDNPDIFTDDWNIPESNNGIPDILDEIKWELDWLYKMVNADGTVILKMGSLDYNINDSAPPSINSSPRYYTPTCSSASLAVASVYAHAAKVYGQIPAMQDFAQILENDAVLCWNRFLEFYNNDNLETNCDDITVKAGDADWDEQAQIDNALVAASYLFDLTGEARYSDFVVDNISQAEPIQLDFYSPNHIVLLEAILNYASLADSDQTTSNFIQNSVLVSLNNNWGNYFAFSDEDLYRAYAPDYVFYWGSNMTMANIGNLCNTIAKYNIASGSNADLLRKAKEQLHYFHGVNPQGIVYLSNMYAYGAERSVNEIYHTWFNEGTDWDNALTSTYGPAPGFLAGGPNQSYTGSLSPPANQPLLKSFLDYNDGFSDVAYEITEPAIYYQAAYIQLLSAYVNSGIISSTQSVSTKISDIKIFPNPFINSIVVDGVAKGNTISLYDNTGALIIKQIASDKQSTFNNLDQTAGIYFVNITDSKGVLIASEKVVKVEDN